MVLQSFGIEYIFSGILSSIFIGHDYMSGFVKNVFTVHSKKIDCVISKIIVGVFCTLCIHYIP